MLNTFLFKVMKFKPLIFLQDNHFKHSSPLYTGLIYLFTPLSWCHNFGKEKYFTNRSRRTFCGIQTEDSKNLFSSTLLDFSSLEFQFYFFIFYFWPFLYFRWMSFPKHFNHLRIGFVVVFLEFKIENVFELYDMKKFEDLF